MTRIPIDLYKHAKRDETYSLLLSREGIRGHAYNIGRELITEPSSLNPCKVRSEQMMKGGFRIEDWKLRKLGWLQSNDKDQGRLAL